MLKADGRWDERICGQDSPLFDEPLVGGMSDRVVVDEAEFDEALDEYFRQAGWDPGTGNPTRGTLEGLNLAWATEEIGE